MKSSGFYKKKWEKMSRKCALHCRDKKWTEMDVTLMRAQMNRLEQLWENARVREDEIFFRNNRKTILAQRIAKMNKIETDIWIKFGSQPKEAARLAGPYQYHRLQMEHQLSKIGITMQEAENAAAVDSWADMS